MKTKSFARKCARVILIIVLLITFYFVEIRSTASVVEYAEAVFRGEIPISETKGYPVNMYNIQSYIEIENMDLKITPIFALHNFFRGYLWVHYSCVVYKQNGDMAYVAVAYSRWKIQREDGEWKIIEISEKP